MKTEYVDFQHHADGTLTCRKANENGSVSGAIFAGKLSDQQAPQIVHAVNAYPKLIQTLRALTEEGHRPRHLTMEEFVSLDVGGIRALLRELGEAK